jgi:hypothetical protein
MRASDLYTIWLKAINLSPSGDVFTITSIAVEKLHPRPTVEKAFLVLSLKETRQRVIVNQTNANRLVYAFGDDYEGWQGKKIRIKPITINQKRSFTIMEEK